MKLIIVFITAALFLPSAYAKTIAIECDSAYYVVGEKYYDLKFILDTDSNVQFGEGGAGTFSDGKLTTQIKDKNHRVKKVLEELIEAGAPKEILYQAKPHIGSDHLVHVVNHNHANE